MTYLKASRRTTLRIIESIVSFLGNVRPNSINFLNIPFGRLVKNKNMEFLYSSGRTYLKTKRGSTLIKDISNKVAGAGNYIYNLTTEYFVWVDAVTGDLKYYNSTADTISVLASGGSTGQNFFEMFGLGTASVLYGVNSTDNVYKISGSTPIYAAVATSPSMVDIAYSTTGKRMVGVNNHTVYWTERQVSATSTANLEDWTGIITKSVTAISLVGEQPVVVNVVDHSFESGDVVTFATVGGTTELNGNSYVITLLNDDWFTLDETFSSNYTAFTSGGTIVSGMPQSSIVNPGDGKGFVRLIDNGEIVFLFKDSGIWALINPEETVFDYLFPKANADIGTISPKSVVRARYGQSEGIIYLGTDKTLRFFNGRVIRNSGQLPTLEGGDSRIISKPFQDLLDLIPDGQMTKVTASYRDRYYVINFPSENDTDIAKSIIVDTEKLMEAEGTDLPQPFWFESENMDYNEMIVRESDNSFYGFNKNGFISQLFINDKFVEDVPTRIDDSGSLAIKYNAITGWKKFADNKIEMAKCFVSYAVGGRWNPTFMVNSFEKGQAVPDIEGTNTTTLKVSDVSGSYFGSAQFNIARFSSSEGQVTQNANLHAKGNYFLFGFSGTNKNEPASLYGIEPIFKVTRVSPVGIS